MGCHTDVILAPYKNSECIKPSISFGNEFDI